MKYTLRSSLIMAILVLLATLNLSAASAAKDAPTATTTWSVAPASAQAPDGRSWVSVKLKPGQSHTDYLAVKNLGKYPATFSIQQADGYFTDTGRFNMLPADQESTGSGTWITAPESVQLDPNETKIIPFTINVPRNATPGDHAAGIAAVLSSVTTTSESTVGIDSRVGFRVMTQVEGEASPGLAVSELKTSYSPAWNPFTPGTLEVSFDVSNTGNLMLAPELSVDTWQGSEHLPDELELLPGDKRTFTFSTDAFWPTILLPTEVQASAYAEFNGESLQADASASTMTLAWPIAQLLLLLGIALIVVGGFARRKKNKQHLAEMLAAARAEAIAETRAKQDTHVHEPV